VSPDNTWLVLETTPDERERTSLWVFVAPAVDWHFNEVSECHDVSAGEVLPILSERVWEPDPMPDPQTVTQTDPEVARFSLEIELSPTASAETPIVRLLGMPPTVRTVR
jgi:hypothetical protein